MILHLAIGIATSFSFLILIPQITRLSTDKSSEINWDTAIPSSQEINLYKQLNLQRVQQQLETEALQHEQRMKEMRFRLAAIDS